MNETTTVTKKGEIQFMINLTRSKGGLILRVKIHPLIEDMMRSFHRDPQVDVQTINRFWSPLKGQPRLMAYSLPPDLTSKDHQVSEKLFYGLQSLGGPLYELSNDGTGHAVVNLSFLRLVGVSGGNGIAFQVAGVWERSSIFALKKALEDAARKVYVDLVKPLDVTIMVSTQEM